MYSDSIQGIRSGLDAFSQSAQKLQRIEKADLPRETVKMMVAEKTVRANALALRTASSLTRDVIDILA